MNKEKFTKKFNECTDYEIDIRRIKSISEKAVDADSHYDEYPLGHIKLINCIEELSELSQELSKELRGLGDKMNIIQELADVYTSIYLIKHICDISDDELAKGINVKLNRIEETLSGYGYYQ